MTLHDGQPFRPVRETVVAGLQRAAANWPDSTWIDLQGRTFTFSDVERRSASLAQGLATLGVTKGDTVVTFLDTDIDPILCWFAINRLGAIWVPLNTAYKGEFLRHQIADSRAKIIIAEAHYVERIEEVADGIPMVETVIVRGENPALCRFDMRRLEDCFIANAVVDLPEIRPSDICCIIYTSGTTGPSKGCMISHNYLCNQARQTNWSVPLAPGEACWSCLPLFHVGGAGFFLLATLLAGNRACIAPRFSVSDFWYDIERTGAVAAMVMASMFQLLAQAPDNPAMRKCHGQLRAVTGIPVSERIRKIWNERFGVAYMNSFIYGQTEASKLAYHRRGDPLPPAESSGRAADEFELRIVGDDGQPAATGELGEIVLRPKYPDIMFSGYWGRPEETLAVWKDLWMHTGDIGRLDEEGNLYFVDRKKDYLRHRGENISSHELEMTFRTHPHVADVAIHSVPGISEDDVKATVIVREGAVLGEKELCLWAIENVPYFAVPRYIEFRTELPRNAIGRVLKFELRGEGVTPATWDREVAGIVVRR